MTVEQGPLVIVGPGRSGSKFAALTLNAHGVACGHERAVGARVAVGARAPMWDGLVAESSQFAAFEPYRWARSAALQVRDPLRVAASKLLGGVYADHPGRARAERRALMILAPSVFEYLEEERRILGHILAATPLGVDFVYRVEDGIPVEELAVLAGVEPRNADPAVVLGGARNFKGEPIPYGEAVERFTRWPEWAAVRALYARWYEGLPT